MNSTGTLLLVAISVLTAGPAAAQTIFVDTSNDVVDFGGAQRVSDLPGPDGLISLPEAGLASDNTPGVQTIGFHIPQSDWQFQWLFPGRAVLRPFLGFRVFDTVILDATTQTAFTGDTYPGGGEVVIWQETYLIDNVGGRVVGFDHSSLHWSGGSNNVIQGNTETSVELYDSASNLIGGANPGEGNSGPEVKLDRSNSNVVIGNILGRVRVLGWVGGSMPATNNRIGGPTPGERNYILGSGTWNSEMMPGGFAVQIFDAQSTVVENNWIGTTTDGLAQADLATTSGILFEGESYDTIIRNNRIAGILGHAYPPHGPAFVTGSAITIGGTGSGISIVGNKIGLNANDQPVLGSVTGIATYNYYLGPVQGIAIGGAAPGTGNEIAGHLQQGITVANSISGMSIRGNSIHDNGNIGIDLVTDGFLYGVTPNDPLDVDTGGNGLQNYPVLQFAAAGGGSLRVVGTLNSRASSGYAIEFFASPQCDASGFGEGSLFLGATTVATDAAGNAAIDATLASSAPPGWFASATATEQVGGSTSEFAGCVGVTGSLVAVYCTPKVNSLGCVPSIGSSGTLSLGDASPFVVTASQVLSSRVGLFVYGKSGRAALPFQGGTLCANPPIRRTPQQSSGGTPPPALDCSGSYAFHFDSWFASGADPGLSLGTIVDGQFWSRDPAASFGAGVTDAIEFVATP
jgi:hypothetical protein